MNVDPKRGMVEGPLSPRLRATHGPCVLLPKTAVLSMRRSRLIRWIILLALVAVVILESHAQSGPLASATQPLWVRLESPVNSAHPGAEVQAVVLRPFPAGDGRGIPMGSRLMGRSVTEAPKSRTRLQLQFDRVRIGARDFPISARVLDVDNARETVEKDGTIVALQPLRKRPGTVEAVLLAAAYAHPALLVSLETTKYVVREVDRPEVHYPPGVNLSLALTSTPPLAALPELSGSEAPLLPGAAAILNELPNRTEAKHLSAPSDWINLAFVGSRDELNHAFREAGWHTAAHLSLESGTRTFLAVAAHHSYQRAPVSTLLVGGREPDLVFQKQNNTFAKRDHIRIWASGKDWRGRPLWIAAATHDIGIEFSTKARTFSHKVDSNVDDERSKVIFDLRFARQVDSVSYLTRPAVPRESINGTGDPIRTDGRMALIELIPPVKPQG